MDSSKASQASGLKPRSQQHWQSSLVATRRLRPSHCSSRGACMTCTCYDTLYTLLDLQIDHRLSLSRLAYNLSSARRASPAGKFSSS